MSLLLPNDNVFRHTQISERDKKLLPDLVPLERCFEPNKNDKGMLSVDCDRFVSAEESLAIKGAQYKTNKTEFKEVDKWDIYSLHISTVTLMDNRIVAFHSPVLINPPEKGKPSNKAHSHIDMTQFTRQDLPEILVKLRNHAKDRKVDVDLEKTLSLVEKYRKQWD